MSITLGWLHLGPASNKLKIWIEGSDFFGVFLCDIPWSERIWFELPYVYILGRFLGFCMPIAANHIPLYTECWWVYITKCPAGALLITLAFLLFLLFLLGSAANSEDWQRPASIYNWTVLDIFFLMFNVFLDIYIYIYIYDNHFS